MSPNKDEPVAYLGGKPEDGDEAVAGYLGGQAGEGKPEDLPALPPAGVSAVYSASDFIAPPPEVEEEPPPAYDSYAADPVAEPAPAAADMEQYAHEPEPEPEPEPPATATVVEQGAQEGSSDFDEPGLPKTISQQDAENIIKRITTKKILPPETGQGETPRISKPSELTPRGSPKLGRLIVLLIIVVGGYGAAVAFNDQVKDYLPDYLWPYIFYTPPPEKPEDKPPPTKTPAQLKEEALRKVMLESEWRAFDFKSKEEFDASNKELKSGAKKPDGGAPTPQPPSDPNAGGH